MAEPRKVDLFVIGAGSGGVRAARIAAGHGARVMIAEQDRIGGTCVIRGCVPKKLLVYASRFGHEFEDAAGYGFTLAPPPFDWPTLIANKDREIARLEGLYRVGLEKAGVEIAAARAVIADAEAVRLMPAGTRIEAKHILIATGFCAVRRRCHSRYRVCDFFRPGVRSQNLSRRDFDPGRRLYRHRICLHLRRPWVESDARLSRTQHPARLRRRRAEPSAWRDGKPGHLHRHRPDRRGDRTAWRALCREAR